MQICDESGGDEGRVTSDEQYAYTKNVPDIQINPGKGSLSTVAILLRKMVTYPIKSSVSVKPNPKPPCFK